jgi:ribosomal protein S18 acetylase RimI-like enzyme
VSVIVRPAAVSDRPAILTLAHRLVVGVAPWRDPEAVDKAVVGWVEGSLAGVGDPDSEVLVAELNGQVVGFVSVKSHQHWSGSSDADIGELVVSTDVERRGVGSTLVRAAVEWGRARDVSRVTVSTGAANIPARRLYASLGFEDEDVTLSLKP